MIYILWTTDSKKEAIKIIHTLLEKKWIACANIIDPIESFFWWDGKIETQKEVKVIFKTLKRRLAEVTQYLDQKSSYEASEITVIEATQAGENYSKWMSQSIN